MLWLGLSGVGLADLWFTLLCYGLCITLLCVCLFLFGFVYCCLCVLFVDLWVGWWGLVVRLVGFVIVLICF